MAASLFIARIFGICYIVVGIGLLRNRKNFEKIVDDFCKNTTLVFYGGIMALVVGMSIILTHNFWIASWRVIITIIGWIALIKGIWIIVFPDTIPGFMEFYKKSKSLITAHSIAALAFGIILTFFGFFRGW